MEIDSSLLTTYITVVKNFLPQKNFDVFFKNIKHMKDWKPAEVVGNGRGAVIKSIRDVEMINLINGELEKEFTKIHWCNFILHKFTKALEQYSKNTNNQKLFIKEIQLLKYSKNNFYNFHVDHGHTTPRTVSMIYFLNKNYEGGELEFQTPLKDKTLKIEKTENTLIMWPSNFLYPHRVTPVKNGTRYSIVSWAL